MCDEQWIHTQVTYDKINLYELCFLEFDVNVFKEILSIQTFFNLIEYIEDITWPCRDMKFLFECWKIFHKWEQRMSEIFFFNMRR